MSRLLILAFIHNKILTVLVYRMFYKGDCSIKVCPSFYDVQLELVKILSQTAIILPNLVSVAIDTSMRKSHD